MTTHSAPLVAAAEPEAPDDQALMARVIARDEAAFRILADRQLGRILRLAQKMLGSAADADEVGQEVLLRVWLNARRWDPRRSRLSTWIYTITYRICLDRLRGRRTETLDEAMDIPDPTPGVYDLLARKADLNQLRSALGALPARQRAALILFYHEELSGQEAAHILNVRLRAFWSLLHRARQAAERFLKPSAP